MNTAQNPSPFKYKTQEEMLKAQGQQAQVDRYGGVGQTSYRSNWDRFMDFLNVGTYTVQGFIHGAITPNESALGDAWEGFKASNPFGSGNPNHEYSFGGNLEQAGWKPTTTGGRLAKFLVGMTGDILLDPTTYLTLGASSVVKGTGTKIAKGAGKVAEVSKFTPEMAQSVLKEINGVKHVADAKDVNRLVDSINKLTGVATPKEVGIGWKGTSLPLSEKLGILGKDFNIVSDAKLREFGDKTIAPYFNAVQDKLKHSKRFSTKGDLIDLARTDPRSLAKLMEFTTTSLERGTQRVEALAKVQEDFKGFSKLDPEVQKKITNILEDKEFWKESEKVKLKDTPEGRKLFNTISNKASDFAEWLKNYGNSDPEMKKVMDSLEPKFKTGEKAVMRGVDGDIPVKIVGEYGTEKGIKYYKIEGSNTGIPENILKTTKEVDDEMKVVNLAKHKEKIKEQVAKQERGRINLSDDKLQEVAVDNVTELPKAKNPNAMSKDEFMQKVTKDKEKQALTSRQTLTDDKGNVIEFKNNGGGKASHLPSQNWDYYNSQLVSLKTGELFNVTDLDRTPVAKITNTKGVPKQLWSKVSKQTPTDIEDFFAKLIDSDPVLNDMFEPLVKSKTLNPTISKKTLTDFIDKYYDGSIKDLQSMMHKFHVDDFRTNKILDEEFGHYGGLTPKEKAMRMERKYELLNNPKELNYKYEELNPMAQSAVGKVETKMSTDIKNREDFMQRTEDARIKANQQTKINTAINSEDPLSKYPKYALMDANKKLDSRKVLATLYQDGEKFLYKSVGKDGKVTVKTVTKEYIESKGYGLRPIKESIPNKGYALEAERNAEARAVKQTGVLYKDGQKVDNIEFLDSNYKQVFVGHGVDAEIRNVADLVEEGYDVWNPNSVSGSTTKKVPSEIGQMYKNNQSDWERLVREQDTAKKANEIISKTDKEFQEKIIKLQNTDKKVIDLPVEQPTAKPTIEEYKKADVTLEEIIGTLPQEIEDAIKLDKINKASADLKQAKIQKLLKEYTQAMENDAEFERFARSVWGDEKLSKVIKEHTTTLSVIQKLDLLDEDIRDIVYDIRSKFKKAGIVESQTGLLDNMYLEGYASHILTPEAKAYIDSLNPKQLADLGLTKPSNNFSYSRIYQVGTVMPDGYKLRFGTVAEINQHLNFKEYDFFVHEIADIYLARMQKHYKLMYDDGMVKDITGKFGKQLKPGDALEANHSLIFSTSDVKKLLKGKTEATRFKILKSYGITQEELDKLGNSFGYVNEKYLDNILKDRFVKIHQVPSVILDKYKALTTAQVAEDVNGLLGAYDKFLYTYKVMATALRPAFHVNNARGNAFNNYLDIGTKVFSPRLNNLTIGILRGKDGIVVLGGTEYTLKQIKREAEKLDVIGKGFFGYDIKKNIARDAEKVATEKGIIGKTVDASMKVGSTVEEHGRLMNFVANLDNGKSFAHSAEHVNEFLFNYDDITKFEHQVMRRIFPFYTWMRKNSVLQLEQMFTNPKKYMPIAKAVNEIKDMTSEEDRVDKSKLPGFAQDWIQLPFTVTNEKGQKEILMWSNSMPYLDINRIPDLFHPSTIPGAVAPQLSPALKVPLELGTNNNFYLQTKIDKGAKVLDPTGTVEVSPQLAYLLQQVPQISEPASNIRKTGIDRLIGMMDKLAGSGVKTYNYGEYSKEFTGTSSKSYTKKTKQNINTK